MRLRNLTIIILDISNDEEEDLNYWLGIYEKKLIWSF